MNSSEYVNNERKEYSLYVLSSRAIPSAADGMKAAARRVLWTAKNGKVFKSASLAGATMPIHPHAAPESTINTIAGDFVNNIPLLDGEGGFGTLLNPGAFAASRYTSVSISNFTKDVIFRDIEIIPMQENYDGSLEEPVHFLPLVPVALLNPQEGIAVGFACTILPRSLDSIIKSQLEYITKGKIKEVFPAFNPTNNTCTDKVVDKNGNIKWVFDGAFDKVNATTVRVTNLPYGIAHNKYLTKIDKLEESGDVVEVIDNSKRAYDIEIRFKKGILRGKSDEEILKLLSLRNNATENLNLIDFKGERVLNTTYGELIERFTEWRLQWYLDRYQRLARLLEVDIQKYLDIIAAIKNNIGGKAPKVKSKAELKELLEGIGIVHVDYIAELSVYRFTEEERKKVEQKLADARVQLKEYQALIKSEDKRKEVYVGELKEVQASYKKGRYS